MIRIFLDTIFVLNRFASPFPYLLCIFLKYYHSLHILSTSIFDDVENVLKAVTGLLAKFFVGLRTILFRDADHSQDGKHQGDGAEGKDHFPE